MALSKKSSSRPQRRRAHSPLAKKVEKRVTKANKTAKRRPAQRKGLEGTSLKPAAKPSAPRPALHQVDSLSPLDQDLPELCSPSPPPLQLPPPLHPLTEHNLRVHTRHVNPDGSSSDMAPRGKSETGLTNITAINCDSHEKLFAYGVRLFSKVSPPAVMNEHVARMKRERTDINSPSARILTSYATKAQGLNEPSAVSLLCQYLVFPDADLERGEQYMKFLTEAYLDSAYVNHPHIPGLSLNSPRADACNGYIPRRQTDDSTQLPFTKEEEAKLTRTPGLPALHWTVLVPWLTAQFKAALAVAGWITAVHQGARDGVAVCEYLHQLFMRAGISFTEEDTCHWSLMCDTFSVGLFVHWRTEAEDGVRYHMAQVDEANLRVFWGENNNVPMRRLRDRMRNILEHAREGRLQRIKMALKNLLLPPQSPTKSPRHARGWSLR